MAAMNRIFTSAPRRWIVIFAGLAIVGVGLALSTESPSASLLKADEAVILFPTAGHWDVKKAVWVVDLHGWIFEPERDDTLRSSAIDKLRKELGLDSDEPTGEIFAQRVRGFLVDNERGKTLTVRIGTETYAVGPSEANGHLRGEALVVATQPGVPTKAETIACSVVLKSSDARQFSGRVHLIPPQGLSVISDIDDTIKVTNIRDPEETVRRTLFEEFEAVDGMAELYTRWEQQGAAFHYVSNSPWQLASPLEEMLQTAKFPQGTVHLRDFRLKDSSIVRFLRKGSAAKRGAIESLLKRWPERRFVLVGDSGEQDPEVYGEIAKAFPQQIAFIAIRLTTEDDPEGARFQNAFRELPREAWQVFTNPVDLALPAFNH